MHCMDGRINGWTDRRTEEMGGWMDGQTCLYVFSDEDNQMFEVSITPNYDLLKNSVYRLKLRKRMTELLKQSIFYNSMYTHTD